MLGNRLFPIIARMHPKLADKITGMLLELDNFELLHMLESEESLEAKVKEAVAVLHAHQAKEGIKGGSDMTKNVTITKNVTFSVGTVCKTYEKCSNVTFIVTFFVGNANSPYEKCNNCYIILDCYIFRCFKALE